MHAILEQFLDRWVWPTMPGAPGAEFRLRLTKEKCVKGWEISLPTTGSAKSTISVQVPRTGFSA